MYKLHYKHKISGQFLKCINSFLRNRFTRVLLKKGSSVWKLQKLGLPQGSSLSPILYILFTNDFKLDNPKFVKMGCFADDTAFWTNPSSLKMLKYKKLQHELNNFTDWTKYWKMSLNPTKCITMKIHKKYKNYTCFNYKIDDFDVKKVDVCRYLGLWIDESLSMSTHLDKITTKVRHNLSHLYFLMNSGINLSPKTIIQLYKIKTRPIIEYASIHYFHKDKRHKMQILQNKFLRCAYPAKISTPIKTLQMIANLEPLQMRINKLHVRHHFRARYSSLLHPLHKAYNEYIINTINMDSGSNHSMENASFSIANNIINNTKSITIKPFNNIINGPITALPKYNIHQIPSNISIILSPISKDQINANEINFYVDGSCCPNPGKGAYGWYAPFYNDTFNISQTYKYEFPVTITKCEINAIGSLLFWIYKNPPKTSNTINIISDSQTTLEYIKLSNYPKYNNTKLEMENIFKTLLLIQSKLPMIHFNFYKVKSHTKVPGNDRIDEMVRKAAQSITFNTSKMNQTSYQVSLTQIHQECQKQWKSHWKINNNPNRLINKYHHKFTKKIHNLVSMANLNNHQCGIIIRLITEHIELNQYLHSKQIKCPTNDKIPPSPNCTKCNKPESVKHFLTSCKKYKYQRSILSSKLRQCHGIFRYYNKIPIKYVLFPYLIKKIEIHQQITIWKEILNYTKNTKRFKNLFKIDTNKL